MNESGLVVVNKPRGMTSFYVVKLIKKALNTKKVGHMGTLDPMANGVLVVGVNKATKLFDECLKHKKEYIATYDFGYETSTLDTEGEVIKQNNIVVEEQELKLILNKFIGKQMQVPPNYSAKKINGHSAYELARKGEQFTLPPKEVELFELEFLRQEKPNCYTVRMVCSSGFYVRSLGRDIAKEFSTYCTTTSITRTICCGFVLSQAQKIDEIINGNIKLMEKNNG